MRTTGTFADVCRAALELVENDYEDSPLDPVIRLENGTWMLESALEPAPDSECECGLEDLISYFADCDDTFIPSDKDEAEFLSVIG